MCSGDHHEHFSIDPNGLVAVRNGALLDRETLAAVVLRVVATDTAPENYRRQSSVPVSIIVPLSLLYIEKCIYKRIIGNYAI